MKRRRKFLVAFALGFLVAPVASFAQQLQKVRRIGVTVAGFAPNAYVESLRRGLTELGWIEGRNILIEVRYAEGRSDRYPAFVAELIDLKAELIVAGGSPEAAKQATSNIPIVIPAVTDPVARGLVASLARPGGNITGLSQQDTETTVKRMELLKTILPRMERVAVLRSSGWAQVQAQADAMEDAARVLQLSLQALTASRVEDLDGAFRAAKGAGAEALIVLASAVFTAHHRRVVDLAAQHRLIAVYEHRDFVEAGGLVSYGPNFEELWRGAARYVDRILKGAKPADLPMEQPTNLELVINMKTAKVLGLTIPRSVLLRANRVIE